MTTIPCRQKRLEENLESILNQSYRFDKLVINIDDNLTEEDYAWYNKLKERDVRMEINVCDHKWRSCNKLLPTIKKYPDAVVITVDDDIYYPKDCILYMVEEYYKSNCIVCQEMHPVLIRDGKFAGYVDDFDVKIGLKCYGKYLSNCCLFPPHIFEGTDLFDYDKMMECVGGTHDELWFWVNSLINGIKAVNLNYILWFAYDLKSEWADSEYRLGNINNPKIREFNTKVTEMYGNRINKVLSEYKPIFYLNKDNVYSFIYQFPKIVKYYSWCGISVNIDGLTSGYQRMIIDFINSHTQSHA